VTNTSCTFDDSLQRAVAVVRQTLPDIEPEAMRFIRDMTGTLYVVVPDSIDDATLRALSERLREALGPYASPNLSVLRCAETLTGTALFEEPVLIHWTDDEFPVFLIERRAVGQDWVVQPETQVADHPPRFVFFSLKGGVGRSTALSLWGRHLTQEGRQVLVIDLDLEAPGLGAQLLPEESQPEFGVLDWLVEDLNGGDTEAVIAAMTAASPVSDAGLIVAPALGTRTRQSPGNAIAKLARAYLEGDQTTDGSQEGFAARLRRMVERLEQSVGADITLIDSRAGLHETAAASLLHLDAEVLLFAVDLPVTWQGYRYLLSHLRQLARSTEVASSSTTANWRERIKMVHARADATQAAESSFVANAYALWTATLYDDLAPEGNEEAAFSFDEYDEAAPHWPYPILRIESLERFDPLTGLNRLGEQALNGAFAGFFDGLAERLEALNYDT